MDPRSSTAIFNEITQVYEEPSPVALAKAIKNDVEINGMKQCHIRDAAALVLSSLFHSFPLFLTLLSFQIQFFAWLEEEIENGATLTEVRVSDKLVEFRKYVFFF